MLSLAIAVAAIALADSINPSLILPALYLAAGPHGRRRTAAFAAGAFAVTFAGGLLIALGVGDLILSFLPKPGATAKYALIVGVGTALVVGGAVIWVRRRQLAEREPSGEEKIQAARGSAALMGAGIAGIELLTAFPYFATITMIVGSGVSVVGKVVLLGIFNVVYVLPLIGIAIVCAVMGPRGAGVLSGIRDRVLTRWPVVVAPLAFAVGVGVTAFGILRLTGV